MKKIILLLILFSSYSCFSQTVSLGNNYSDKEIKSLEEKLVLLYEIKINKKNILIYGEKENQDKFYNEKLLLVKNLNGKNIFNEGIYLLDNDSIFSFYRDEKNCAFMLKNSTDKTTSYNEIFLIKSSDNKVYKISVKEKFISSLVVLNDIIYYSTEHDDFCLKCLDIKSGKLQNLPLTSPNAELIVINNKLVLGKTIDSKLFYIQDDDLIYVDDLFSSKENLFNSFRKK